MNKLDIAFNNLTSEEIEIESWVDCSKFTQKGDTSKDMSPSLIVSERNELGVKSEGKNIVESIKKQNRKKVRAKQNLITKYLNNKTSLKGRSFTILQNKNTKHT